MKRLNGMLAVLTDTGRRTAYDASLIARPLPPGRSPIREILWRTDVLFMFGVASLLCVAIALWPQRKIVPQPAAMPVAEIKRAAIPSKKSYSPPHATPKPAQFVPVMPPEIAAGPVPPEIGCAGESACATTVGPQLAEPGSAGIQPAERLHRALIYETPPPPGLSGRWLYVRSTSVRQDGYPPEYIELRLRENDGLLHGRYQARYRIPDRAISPEVAFRFEGRAGPDGGVLPWQGPGEAHGDITLRLLPSGGLQVDWVARQLGRELALVSGTAMLVRKLE
jgi:hypothetical protein